MEAKPLAGSTLIKQFSLAPDRQDSVTFSGADVCSSEIDPEVKIMYLTNEGDFDGIKELLDSGTDVNFKDIEKRRTTLHIAACQGLTDVVELLVQNGAVVDPQVQ
ncbi:Serine/threonine-protein kinase [Quillaja saponaria]|uniref:Serine/threonine-protein kinase n=1 Tax=Quillaja saponaria TaxID=32244 RepID=A0AAD7LT25_QUISA|nr:Serine/threonine-protein kinase [Quillaja saponaria]